MTGKEIALRTAAIKREKSFNLVRFADEARRIHYGEAEERGIRGQATSEQAEELLDEGIAVVALLVPPGFKSTLQ